jgi:hypothetical protein|nr:MAG: hypothetical protein KatS3mg041_1302 [Bacteroidota bacterium]
MAVEVMFSPTPNPNSVKITADRPFIESGSLSFTSPDKAVGHPLAEPIFALGGIYSVFIMPQFLTVTKMPQEDWDRLLPAIREIVVRYFEHAP